MWTRRSRYLQKEGFHNRHLKVTVEGEAQTGYRVLVEADDFVLIDDIMDERPAYEYRDDEEQRRERLAPNTMRFV